MMANPKRIFEEPFMSPYGIGCISLFNTDDFKKDLYHKERKDMSFRLPDLLRTPRALSSEEFEKTNFMAGKPDVTYFLDAKPQFEQEPVPFARHVSSETMREIELLPALIWLREQLFTTDFLKKLRLCQKHGVKYSEEKLRTTLKTEGNDVTEGSFSLGLSCLPHTGPGAICLGNIGRAQDPDIDAWRKYLFQIGNTILYNCFPDKYPEARRKLWLKGSFTPCFSAGSSLLTSAWINIFDPLKLAESPPANPFGNQRDAPTEYAVVLNLSNMPENFYGGRISLPSQRISFSLRPLEALIFPARHYQFTTGVGPYAEQRDSDIPLSVDSPLRLPRDLRVPDLPPDAPKLRITVPLYSTLPLIEARFASFQEEIWTDIMHNIMDPMDHRVFMMRQYIENEILIPSRSQDYEPDDIEGSGPLRMAHATKTFKKQRLPHRIQHDDPFILKEGETPASMRLRMQKIPADVLEAFRIPEGDGLELSHDQLRSLLKLKGADRRKRASRVFNANGHALPRYAYLEEEKAPLRDFENTKNEYYENVARGLTRNGDPAHYARLFAWTDPDGQVHYPSAELAAEALKNHGLPNEEMEKLEKRCVSFLCGSGLPGKLKGDKKGKYECHVEWTHTGLEHIFDPERETVPDNPLWNRYLHGDPMVE